MELPEKFKNTRKTCSVPGCKIKNGYQVSFHRYPQNALVRKKWMQLLKVKCYADCLRVCSQHFLPDAFFPRRTKNQKVTLKKNVLPQLVVSQQTENHIQRGKQKREKYSNFTTDEDTIMNLPLLSERKEKIETTNIKPDIINRETIKINSTENKTMKINNLQILQENNNKFGNETQVYKQRQQPVIMCDATTQVNFFHDNPRYHNQETQTESFSISKFIHYDEELTAFTGLSSFTFLAFLITCLSTLRAEFNKTERLYESRFILDIKERILLTLMKLKLNLPYMGLSVLFQVSPDTCKKYFLRTLPELCQISSSIIRLPNKNDIFKNLRKHIEKYRKIEMPIVHDHDKIRNLSHQDYSHIMSFPDDEKNKQTAPLLPNSIAPESSQETTIMLPSRTSKATLPISEQVKLISIIYFDHNYSEL